MFLDERLEPYRDQWAFLASVVRLHPAAVGRIAKEATRRGQVVGVQLAESADEQDAVPWMRLPSRRGQACGVWRSHPFGDRVGRARAKTIKLMIVLIVQTLRGPYASGHPRPMRLTSR